MDATELAELVDLFHETRESRLELQHKVDDLEKEEKNLKKILAEYLRDNAVKAIGGTHLTVSYKPKRKPVVQEWDALYAYIREHDAFELLHKRVTERAVKERWAEGDIVPGVVEVEIPDISLSTRR